MATNWSGADVDGLSRVAPTKLIGPSFVTSTAKDRAVGLGVRPRIRPRRPDRVGFGGPDDQYGGIGRNGALKTIDTDALTLLDVSGRYPFTRDPVANLHHDVFTRDQSDATGQQVAHALLSLLSSCVATAVPTP